MCNSNSLLFNISMRYLHNSNLDCFMERERERERESCAYLSFFKQTMNSEMFLSQLTDDPNFLTYFRHYLELYALLGLALWAEL